MLEQNLQNTQTNDFNSVESLQQGLNDKIPKFLVNCRKNPNLNLAFISKHVGGSSKATSRHCLVQVDLESLSDTLDIYEWRSTTQYPIVQAQWIGVFLNKSTTRLRDRKTLFQALSNLSVLSGPVCIEVVTEPVCLLSHYAPLPFSSFVYAFKEAITGFQRLFALFGSFKLSKDSIAVTPTGKVKVWISSSMSHNCKAQLSQAENSESQIVRQLIDLFKEFSSPTTIFKDFFARMETESTFFGLFKGLLQFTGHNRVIASKGIHKQVSKPVKLTQTEVKQVCKDTQVHNFHVRSTNDSNRLDPAILQQIQTSKYFRKYSENIPSIEHQQAGLSKRSSTSIQKQQIKFQAPVQSTECRQGVDLKPRVRKFDSLEQNLDGLFHDEPSGEDTIIESGLLAFGGDLHQSMYEEQMV